MVKKVGAVSVETAACICAVILPHVHSLTVQQYTYGTYGINHIKPKTYL